MDRTNQQILKHGRAADVLTLRTATTWQATGEHTTAQITTSLEEQLFMVQYGSGKCPLNLPNAMTRDISGAGSA